MEQDREQQAEGDQVGGDSGSESFQHLREFYERMSAQWAAGTSQPDRPAGP